MAIINAINAKDRTHTTLLLLKCCFRSGFNQTFGELRAHRIRTGSQKKVNEQTN